MCFNTKKRIQEMLLAHACSSLFYSSACGLFFSLWCCLCVYIHQDQQLGDQIIAAVEHGLSGVNQSVADIRNDIQQCACIPCGDTGSSSSNPATSCAALPISCASGYYWVRASNGSTVHVFCDMTRSCGGVNWRVDENCSS